MLRTREPGLVNPSAAVSYSAEVLKDEPAAYWRMDEGAGAGTFKDSSGNGRHMTENGTLTTGNDLHGGPFGAQSLDFDYAFNPGTEYLSLASATWMNQAKWTAELIFNCDGATSGDQLYPLMSRETGSGADRSWAIYKYNAGIRVYNDTGVWLDSGNIGVGSGTSHHLVCVFHTSAILHIYLDGVLQVADIDGVSTTTTVSAPLQIGSATAGIGGVSSYWTFDGEIADVAYYDYALGSNRILAHATAAGLV